MNALVKRDHFDLSEIFAPPDPRTIGTLVEEHHTKLARIREVAALFDSEADREIVRLFLKSCEDGDSGRLGLERLSDRLFDRGAAEAALNAEYWDELLRLTDVLDYMPQKRKDEWFESIRKMEVPGFDAETVAETLKALLADRHKFLAEKVDGVFRGLSGEHVTNSPQGFRKRMILAHVFDHMGFPHGRQAGLINDLRQVIAKFMGRDEPGHRASDSVLGWLRREQTGQWIDIDGGALRARVYKKGTAHLEVHPEMAWRLNCVLASLYPTAIAPEARAKPRRKPKEVELFDRPLPFAVLALLQDLTASQHDTTRFPDYGYAWSRADKHVVAETRRVLEALGATHDGRAFVFDYNARLVIKMVIATGVLPDQKAHQFYPTPPDLAARMVELADIGPDHIVLEPSAGQGAIAELLPKDRTECVEVSKLHCEILRAKGFKVECGDFLDDMVIPGAFDRVVMNPPFDRGQWRAHVEAAAEALRSGGRLVAVLPSGAVGRDVLPGWAVTWSEPIEDAFPGTSVSVVILVTDKPE